jgi:hypothetical protein
MNIELLNALYTPGVALLSVLFAGLLAVLWLRRHYAQA